MVTATAIFLITYRSSVRESNGYTPEFLVFVQELSLFIDCMYPNPEENETTNIHELLHNKQQAFQRVFELVRRNLNEKQKRSSVIYSKKVHGPAYKEGEKLCSIFQPSLLEQHIISQALEMDILVNCLRVVTFRIKEENSSKQQIVDYGRLKPFVEPPPTSNIPTRNTPGKFHSTQDIANTHKQIDGTLNVDVNILVSC